jgi:hypothetical protein
MHWYLETTEHAVKALIGLIADERQLSEFLAHQHEAASRKSEHFYGNFRSMDLQEDFNDYQVMHAYAQSFRAHEEVQDVERQIAEVEAKRAARASSYAAICGALLQVAKQGISAEYGKHRDGAPEARRIGSEPLRNVIWEGRNQSMHFETPEQVGPKIRATFATLEADFGAQFHLPPAPGDLRNLAGEVVELLGWWKYETYLSDIGAFLT